MYGAGIGSIMPRFAKTTPSKLPHKSTKDDARDRKEDLSEEVSRFSQNQRALDGTKISQSRMRRNLALICLRYDRSFDGTDEVDLDSWTIFTEKSVVEKLPDRAPEDVGSSLAFTEPLDARFAEPGPDYDGKDEPSDAEDVDNLAQDESDIEDGVEDDAENHIDPEKDLILKLQKCSGGDVTSDQLLQTTDEQTNGHGTPAERTAFEKLLRSDGKLSRTVSAKPEVESKPDQFSSFAYNVVDKIRRATNRKIKAPRPKTGKMDLLSVVKQEQDTAGYGSAPGSPRKVMKTDMHSAPNTPRKVSVRSVDSLDEYSTSTPPNSPSALRDGVNVVTTMMGRRLIYTPSKSGGRTEGVCGCNTFGLCLKHGNVSSE